MKHFFLFLFFLILPLTADEELPSVEEIATRLEALGDADLSPEELASRQKALQSLQQLLTQRERSQNNIRTAEAELKKAPGQLEALKKAAQNTPAAPDWDQLSLEEMLAFQEQLESRLTTLKSEQASLESAQKAREQRRQNAPAQLTAAQEALAEATLPQKPLANAPAEKLLAYETALATQALLESQLKELEKRQERDRVTAPLHAAQLEEVQNEIKESEERLEALTSALSQKKRENSLKAEQMAADQAERFQNHPDLLEITRENAALASERLELISQLRELRDEQAVISKHREALAQLRKHSQERIQLL
ncbi:MAG: hypothetical protein ACQKBY_03390, partial [Verrucomicrobiales bacterium]